MRRWRRLLRGVALIAAMGGGVFAGSIVAWSESQATSDEFQQAVLPVLAKNCFGCHSDRLHTGDLSLEPFRDVSLAPQKPDIWQKVLAKLTAGQMPPRPMAPLSRLILRPSRRGFESCVSDTAVADPAAIDPGRVTMRRLNRDHKTTSPGWLSPGGATILPSYFSFRTVGFKVPPQTFPTTSECGLMFFLGVARSFARQIRQDGYRAYSATDWQNDQASRRPTPQLQVPAVARPRFEPGEQFVNNLTPNTG